VKSRKQVVSCLNRAIDHIKKTGDQDAFSAIQCVSQSEQVREDAYWAIRDNLADTYETITGFCWNASRGQVLNLLRRTARKLSTTKAGAK
jgi:hypothetical protein